jgi:NADH dehydrogenase
MQGQMIPANLSVVTGANGFTGRYLTRLLLDRGERVLSLTGHPDREHPFGASVEQHAFNFNQPDSLIQTLQGAEVLYNTYWIRFPHGKLDFSVAVQNSKQLFQAARQAGVSRVVHTSITNPHQGHELPYFAGKDEVEGALIDSGLSYAILRPAVIFGPGDILLNNLAFFLRRLPVMLMPGDGQYQLRPIYVQDLATLMAYQGLQRRNTTIDAVGPETFTYRDWIELTKQAVASRAVIVPAPKRLVWLLTKVLNLWVGDVVLTWNEIRGLTQNLLDSRAMAAGTTSLRAWLQENAAQVGSDYHSELSRHYD